MPVVTALYAGILGLIAIGVAFPAGRLRGSTGISIGDGGNPELLLAMRRHGNFAESVPILLILFGLLELNGVSALAIHVMGISLVAARIAHATGLKADTTAGFGRAFGAGVTALLTLVASVWAIVVFF